MTKQELFIGGALAAIGVASGISLVVSLSTAENYKKQKEENESIAKTLKDKLNMTVDEVRKATPIEIQEHVIEAAVKESADFVVSDWAHTDGKAIHAKVRSDMDIICSNAVRDLKDEMRPTVKHILEEQAKNVSIDDIQRAVIGKTSQEVGDKLKRRMDAEVDKMVKDQNERIQSLNKVYDNINAALKKGDDK